MDLSNLSSTLPLSMEPTEDALSTINKELADEFKAGARSIAALYRLSNTKTSLLVAKGYLDCLHDIASLLDNEQIASLSDLRHFLDTKKHDLCPGSSAKPPSSSPASPHPPPPPQTASPDVPTAGGPSPAAASTPNASLSTTNETFIGHHTPSAVGSPAARSHPLAISSDHRFTISDPTDHHFPPSRLPLSIDHSNLRYYDKSRPSSKRHTHLTASASTSASSKTAASNTAGKNLHRPAYNSASVFANNISVSSDEEIVEDDVDDFGGKPTPLPSDYRVDSSFDDSNTGPKRKLLDASIPSKKQKS